MKAQWKRGSKFSGSAQKVYDEIERIKKKHGGVYLARHLVEEGKRENSPLHPHIWKISDAEAAEQHRLELARRLSRSIEVVYDEAPDTPVRAYELITQPAKGDMLERKVYTSTKEALEDPEMRDEILSRAIRDAIAYKRKYADLQELAQVFIALDEFLLTHKL